MPSKYLSSLSSQEYVALTEKLWAIQNQKCFICQDAIDLELHSTNVDHITPLANKGKDSEENFAVTHESCNKSKQDADLKIARILHRLKKIQDARFQADQKSASLREVLGSVGGSKFPFRFREENGRLHYTFSELGRNDVIEAPIFRDALSGVSTCFIEFPLEYVHHDDLINPRGINSSISKLIKEFDKKNPQLHLSLARIDGDQIKIFWNGLIKRDRKLSYNGEDEKIRHGV